MCQKCKLALATYNKFKTEIQQTHAKIRNVTNDYDGEEVIDSDDCMVIENDDEPEMISLEPKNIKNEEDLLVEVNKEDDSNGKDQSNSSNKHVKNKSHNQSEPRKLSFDSSDGLKCLDCDIVVGGIHALLRHRVEMHAEDEKDYPSMPSPPYAPVRIQRIPRAKKQQEEQIIVACEFCFLEMYEKNLDDHILQCHTENGKKFLCHICSNAFTKEGALKYHLVSHQLEKMFFCDLCDRKYTQKSKIRRHMIGSHASIMTAMKSYAHECRICMKKFRSRLRYENHMRASHKNGYDCGARVNSETNHYDCYKCGGSYNFLSIYRSHLCERGRYQIKCDDCHMPMANTEKLKKHKKNCRIGKPFGC